MEASSNNSTSGSGSNDNAERQFFEEMEALCDVDFPIFDKSAKAEHHHDGKKDNGKSSTNAVNNNKPAGNKVVDEDAIMRCFDLSIKSHFGGTPVPVFDPVPPTPEKNDDK